MTRYVVHTRMNREQGEALVRSLQLVLSGRAPDTLGIARGVFLSVGFQALADIKEDFIRKSRGGIGDDGEKWKPLSQAYLAYQRRFGRGEQKNLKTAAGLGKGHRFGVGGNKGLLTKDQQKRWNKLFAQKFARLAVSLGEGEAKARAAKHAWAVLKAEGAKTMLEVFGNRQVDILRDTGRLLASLSPGELTGSGYRLTCHRPPNGGDQILNTIANGVTVGTNVEYAGACNKLRPFLPAKLPAKWQDNMTQVAADALAAGVRMAFQMGA